MRRLPVSFRPDALDDLGDIFRFVREASGSVSVAASFVRRIKFRCDRIGDAPPAGRPRDDLVSGLRTVPFERSAVIAYLVEDDRVRITNIFYGGKDYEALYRRSDDDPGTEPT
ncbi:MULTISPECIES: type II toxin-antitoxin system RelE/ParE family toxin [unclassified Methylobacterium]|uniref:type II toxin-antitoxin system RelE/ParE family toxin n=1 Tax=unclassified Methylobacterium TaxID=2615210 RepID=UPI00070142A3|nr:MULTISPECIES: type II toxin-antitoxin system RelE/ParE family toxin [unclassified Methylobacterium]KQO54292.1 plasmid stabilization protein [Methylobacterium sp. Leaf86]KQO90267.1 plasmid stabilization protein [Methylobacterium sp. Leaf91]